jgi:hypothetical protein
MADKRAQFTIKRLRVLKPFLATKTSAVAKGYGGTSQGTKNYLFI